tara:strand:- start:36 stop:563 length:528 start_codon:yes stop_codon:yes gene_type:complete
MKTLLQLTEVSKEDLPTIYCDMDQVLVNLLKGAEKVLGQPLDSFKGPEAKQDRWKRINAVKDFWPNLEWMPNAKKLYQFIARYDTKILSAYTNKDPNSRPGKLKWLAKNTDMKRKNILLVLRADKQNYAVSDGKPNVLIDDHSKNIREWNAKGGIGILHTSVSKTIAELKRLGFK